MKMNKLCSNLDQSNPAAGGFTDEEKQTMRHNIGAAAASDVTVWHEMTVDTTKRDSSELNLIADFDFDGCIGYYFDNNTSLRLTWWHNAMEDYPVFRIYDNNNYTDINGPVFQDATPLSTQFYNGNGQHNTLRWKLSTFKCVDIHFNPSTAKLYWKEM